MPHNGVQQFTGKQDARAMRNSALFGFAICVVGFLIAFVL